MRPLRIFFSCSGVGIIDRGIEVFFREAFDALRGTEGLDITLFKGAGEEKSNEYVLWKVPRTGRAARFLGAAIRRNSYVAEQLSTFPSMMRAVRRHRPDIIFYSDSNLGFQLFRWRKQIGVPFRLLFSNGGPCHPPFDRTDYVHQVAPFYYEEAAGRQITGSTSHGSVRNQCFGRTSRSRRKLSGRAAPEAPSARRSSHNSQCRLDFGETETDGLCRP